MLCRVIRSEGEAGAVQGDGGFCGLVTGSGLEVAGAGDEKNGLDLWVLREGALEDAFGCLLVGQIQMKGNESFKGLRLPAEGDALDSALAMSFRQGASDAGGGADDCGGDGHLWGKRGCGSPWEMQRSIGHSGLGPFTENDTNIGCITNGEFSGAPVFQSDHPAIGVQDLRGALRDLGVD